MRKELLALDHIFVWLTELKIPDFRRQELATPTESQAV